MKKKRVILHLCILMLTTICIGTGIYMFKNFNDLRPKDEYKREYQSYYNSCVNEAIEDAYAQYVLRRDFLNFDRVIAEDKDEGKFTVRDLMKVYLDKYDTWDKTYYKKLKQSKKQLKKDNSKRNKERYAYYKKIDNARDRYYYCLMNLNEGDGWYYVSDESDIERLLQEPNYTNFCCNIKYKIDGKKYEMANVKSKELASRDTYVDTATVEKEKLLLLKDGIISDNKIHILPSYFGNDEVRKFVKNNVVEMTFGVNGRFPYDDYLKQSYAKYENGLTVSETKKLQDRFLILLAIDAVVLVVVIALFIILLIDAGHKRKGDAPRLNKTDKIWMDVQIAVLGGGFTLAIAGTTLLIDNIYGTSMITAVNLSLALLAVVVLAAVEVLVLMGESFARRLKCKSLIRTTLIGRIFIFVKRLLGKLLRNMKLSIRVICLGIVLVAWQIFEWMFIYNGNEGIAFFVAVGLAVAAMYIVWKYFSEHKKLEEGTKRIAGGDVNYKIEGKMKFQANKSMKESINNIGDGLNAAVSERMRSERMKTELITNVSHDLKTPLTSIINYVDLLKTDGLESKKAEQYLDVLDQKSQRLKNLTEDLVEVSKLNSGVAKLQKERLDIVQLINQSLGEYNEKFAKNKLQIIKTIQEEPLYVMADGRKTWRLFENLYENVFKYAMPNTRVYVDVKTENDKVIVAVKNISKNPLNFSADELMERFVRGDVSRSTEGSGLGLSIAKSIAQRQDSEMNIMLDGDLFKVEIVMNLIR